MPLATTGPTYSVNSSVIDAVTLQQTMDGAWPDWMNYSCILKKMEEAGTIDKKADGAFLTKNIDVGLGVAQERSAAQTRSFNSENDYVNLIMPWTNVEANRGLSSLDVRVNSGANGKVKLNEQLIQKLKDTMKVALLTRILTYNAGTTTVAGFTAATANPPPLGGLPTLFGYGASAQAYNPVTRSSSGAWSAASKYVLPNTTYYGVSTNPLSPPATVANPQFECLSPVISAYTATVWNATATGTWLNNCREVLNGHITRQTRGNGPDERPDFAAMSQTMFTDLINTFQAYYRTVLAGEAQDPNMRAISGTDQQIPYGPLTLHYDSYLTQEVCYVLNSKKMGLSLFPADKIVIDPSLPNKGTSMFTVETNYDMTSGAHLASVGLLGQMWLDPRYHGMSYAAA